MLVYQYTDAKLSNSLTIITDRQQELTEVAPQRGLSAPNLRITTWIRSRQLGSETGERRPYPKFQKDSFMKVFNMRTPISIKS